jgi:hypothetical protein
VTNIVKDNDKRTSKYIIAQASVNSNNFIVVDEEVKKSKSLIYVNNTQRD